MAWDNATKRRIYEERKSQGIRRKKHEPSLQTIIMRKGVRSTRPDRNCFLCGSANWCEHNSA